MTLNDVKRLTPGAHSFSGELSEPKPAEILVFRRLPEAEPKLRGHIYFCVKSKPPGIGRKITAGTDRPLKNNLSERLVFDAG